MRGLGEVLLFLGKQGIGSMKASASFNGDRNRSTPSSLLVLMYFHSWRSTMNTVLMNSTNPIKHPPFQFASNSFPHNAAIHDLDIARWLMGSRGANEPVRVYATGACNVDKAILALKDSNPSEAIDTANILIEFESGSTATIQVCVFVCVCLMWLVWCCFIAPVSSFVLYMVI